MGAHYLGQEIGIEELRNMSEDARQYLAHHLRNSLTGIAGGADIITEDLFGTNLYKLDTARIIECLKLIKQGVKHICEDLERIGC